MGRDKQIQGSYGATGPHKVAKQPGKGRRLTSQSKTIIDQVRVALLLNGWTTKTWQNVSAQSSYGSVYTTVST